MNKSSYMRYARNVLGYLNAEYECENELDHSPEGVTKAKKFIKGCYKENRSFQYCCGLLVRFVIRKNKEYNKETEEFVDKKEVSDDPYNQLFPRDTE